MGDKKKFLLGNGDNLRERYTPGRGGGPKSHPYSLGDTKERLIPRLREVSANFMELDSAACPKNEATALLTLHPSYIAKSYYPFGLIEGLGLRSLGSRSCQIIPDKVTTKDPPQESESVEIYVSGDRKGFVDWADTLDSWTERNYQNEIIRVEDIKPLTPDLRLKTIQEDSPEPLLEIVLHAGPSDGYVLEGFVDYINSLGIKTDSIEKYFQLKGLLFLPLRVPKNKIKAVAEFSFIRVIRAMPKLRSPLGINLPTRQVANRFSCKLPDQEATMPSLKAAIFDGGLPLNHSLKKWVNHLPKEGSKSIYDYENHGLAVTSALLFGSIEPDKNLPLPPGVIDHYRVFDSQVKEEDPDLYDVLARIDDVLRNNDYEFINLSIGPYLPVDDNDIHAWTAVLDEHLEDGKTLATLAVGNDGHLDRDSGNARIQVPADCVNGFAIGACDNLEKPWNRAPYSSIGPGRSPGIVKPDCVAFGGVPSNPFNVLSSATTAIGLSGTSFASPLALHTAMCIRAQMGEQLDALSLKALLINRSEKNEEHIHEIGWGKISSDIDQIVTCRAGEVRVVYHGMLKPTSYVRLPIPMPAKQVAGMIEITATFCFTSKTDPQDSANYTRSGLTIAFRPDYHRYKDSDKQTNPDSRPFFQAKTYASESELRKDCHKWETTLHYTKRMRGSSLNEPVFDVHHGAREQGHRVLTENAVEEIPYALVVNIKAPKEKDIYTKVLKRYPNKLRTMTPAVEIPIRTLGH